MKFSFSTLSLFLLLSVSSIQTSFAVPKEMPDDFSINYAFSGGKSPTFKTIQIKIGDCYFNARMNFDDVPLEYSFQLSRNELTPLYNDLRALNAFTLKSKKTKVSDRGGESISYTINKKIYQVSDSGVNFIVASHAKAFAKSVLLINALVAKYQP